MKTKKNSYIIDVLQLNSFSKHEKSLIEDLYSKFEKIKNHDYPRRLIKGNYQGLFELGLRSNKLPEKIKIALKASLSNPENDEQLLCAEAIFVVIGYEEVFQ